jgi:formylglycine-generating enzyme required for sulfatase activity
MIPHLAKTLAVIVSSTILATLAVNAIDMRGHFADTLLGNIFSVMNREQATGPCPENMTLVTQALVPFCVDMYEASVGAACSFKQPETADQTAMNLVDASCKAESHPNAMPWRFITQQQAQLACSHAGKRLLTAGEWYKAALGTTDPNTGWQEDSCNVAHNRADGVDETGTGVRCVSDAGAYDMVGNVWEWIEGTSHMGDWQGRALPQSGFVAGADMDGIAYETNSSQQQLFSDDRFWVDSTVHAGIMRGGAFGSNSGAGVFSTYAASPPTFSGDAVGFRCATTPQAL